MLVPLEPEGPSVDPLYRGNRADPGTTR